MDQKIAIKINALTQIVMYESLWAICIYTAANDQVWLGFLISIPMIATQLSVAYHFQLIDKSIIYALVLATLGISVDTLLFSIGLFQFNARIAEYTIAPPFLWGIWFSFSLMFYTVLQNWFQRYVLIGICAFLGFPIAYFFGATWGAASTEHGLSAYLILGLLWGSLLPIYLKLTQRKNNAK